MDTPPSVSIVSRTTVFPDEPSDFRRIKLTVSDLPMLSLHYIQKGLLFSRPKASESGDFFAGFRQSLSKALNQFPMLAGRMTTDTNGHVFVVCNGEGADLTHAKLDGFSISGVLSPEYTPEIVREFFAMDGVGSYSGHFMPLLAVQITELDDGVFIGCSVNHAVVDGTSYWEFFNAWAAIHCQKKEVSRRAMPEIGRKFVKDSMAVLKFQDGGPPPPPILGPSQLCERIIGFSREAVLELKTMANRLNQRETPPNLAEIMGKECNDKKLKRSGGAANFGIDDGYGNENNENVFNMAAPPNAPELPNFVEFSRKKNKDERLNNHRKDPAITNFCNGEAIGKATHDNWLKFRIRNGVVPPNLAAIRPPLASPPNLSARKDEISSFQALCGLLWVSVTRARRMEPGALTMFRMAVNCRHRMRPPVAPDYFGNGIQSMPTQAKARDVTGLSLGWCAALLHKGVGAYDNDTIRRCIEAWEREPKCFPLGDSNGATITMGSSPRFPMYGPDFGWGPPLCVRSGRANKFDGKISAFPGKEGPGSVDLEVCLKPETMARLVNDPEFMRFVTVG
ncbi:acylsugar acyltransferase 3 [Amborella trichopoda]|uniref:Uncharacterized protein n=1 Tax=Amborella trichopoda TaxID=13333 RepID=W1PPK5_AMBTC|nr:acylsugar acyltransferase 3 [Amborella trichopoda]ERN09709.1 hypothetical protein AMTR_s00029p00222850 [Amborella trichopoda]|eukprot:XP_006848128.1 acylsugar acyltransferase 3 [Amborella trichopoda]